MPTYSIDWIYLETPARLYILASTHGRILLIKYSINISTNFLNKSYQWEYLIDTGINKLKIVKSPLFANQEGIFVIYKQKSGINDIVGV